MSALDVARAEGQDAVVELFLAYAADAEGVRSQLIASLNAAGFSPFHPSPFLFPLFPPLPSSSSSSLLSLLLTPHP